MKKNILLIITTVLWSKIAFSQYSNKIGLDFGGYAVATPKKNLSGDKYNSFMESSSSIVGLYYDRYLGESQFSIKGGFYFNKQFNSLVSFHIPLEINGNLLGKRDESTVFLAYTAGASLNFIREVVYSFRTPEPNTSSDILINKDFYIAPHFGLSTGLNFNRFGILVSGLFHFLVPEYVKYETTFEENSTTTTQYNTNKSIGTSLRIGASYRF